ncbi:MAG TPA: hypothetical protein VJS20_05370, partial [Gemmatimonadales bacterium]|nr:hypothetical protein [Gemmatimonadales bacterium]
RAPPDARDPVALNQQLPLVGLRAGGVDDAYVREGTFDMSGSFGKGIASTDRPAEPCARDLS